jgi:hypothetical protein
LDNYGLLNDRRLLNNDRRGTDNNRRRRNHHTESIGAVKTPIAPAPTVAMAASVGSVIAGIADAQIDAGLTCVPREAKHKHRGEDKLSQ